MIRYTLSATPEQLAAAARLIDASGQLKRPLKVDRFLKSRVIAVALDEGGEILGVGVIKKTRKESRHIAESGNLVVQERCRGQGIASRLMEIRIEEARRQGIELLYAKVRKSNAAPRGILQRAGFRLWGDFVKPPGTGSAASWFYLPLTPEIDARALMEELTRGRIRVG